VRDLALVFVLQIDTVHNGVDSGLHSSDTAITLEELKIRVGREFGGIENAASGSLVVAMVPRMRIAHLGSHTAPSLWSQHIGASKHSVASPLGSRHPLI
jgi:hypothetical protein